MNVWLIAFLVWLLPALVLGLLLAWTVAKDVLATRRSQGETVTRDRAPSP